jgi:hypothetical protein
LITHRVSLSGLSRLNREARALRIAHIAIGVIGLGSLGYVWLCALTGRRDRILGAAVAALSVQGVALIIGRGNCPLGPIQRRVDDPTPLFELVLPPRAAKAAVPVLVTVALVGVAIVAVRSRPRR